METTPELVGAANAVMLATDETRGAALRAYGELVRQQTLEQAAQEVEELRTYLVENHAKGDRSWRPMATAYGVARRAIERLRSNG